MFMFLTSHALLAILWSYRPAAVKEAEELAVNIVKEVPGTFGGPRHFDLVQHWRDMSCMYAVLTHTYTFMEQNIHANASSELKYVCCT